MDLEMRAEKTDRGLVLSLIGELTGPMTAEFKSWAVEQSADHSGDVFLECKRLHFIDSSGLGSLIYLRKHVVEAGGEFALTEVGGWLQKFLQVTGLEETFLPDMDSEGHSA